MLERASSQLGIGEVTKDRRDWQAQVFGHEAPRRTTTSLGRDPSSKANSCA